MNEETVLDLIKKGESETVEFKTSFDREAVETLVAFANTQGGIVLIGVADDGSIRGVTLGKETLNDWLVQIKSATSPSIIPDMEALPIAGRTVRFAYPLPALREALLNAVVHRDYANPSDIQIKIFDDRITFFSPGKLYGGLTVEDLKTDHYQSHLRNKLIAEAFYLTKKIEKYGSGFIRIRKELEAYPEVDFQVEEIGDGFMVTFRSKAKASGGVFEGVSEGVNAILACIRENPGLRIPELSEKLRMPAKSLERRIKQLREEGRVVFQGAPKTGGYFIQESDSSPAKR